MVLEATVICVDNSDYARNGDFVPTRLLAQQDAVSIVCHSKKSNAENTVGLICMSGAEVLVTLTPDAQRVMSRLQSVQSAGTIQFGTSIRVAHLALRHRQSRNQRMRIVAFVGSPIEEEEKDLVRLGKRLKKENVSVDIVNFGEEEANQGKLAALLEAINGKDGTGSHLVTVTAGSMLHDSLVSSPIIVGEDGSGSLPAGAFGSAGGGGGFDFGVDAQDDPELALALRVSMEEQRARQEQQSATAGQDPSVAAAASAAEGSSAPRTAEDAMLARVMSANTQSATAASADPSNANTGSASAMDTDMDMLAAMTEEEQIEMALRMSLQQDADAAASEQQQQQQQQQSSATDASSAGNTSTDGLDPPSKKIKVDNPSAAAAVGSSNLPSTASQSHNVADVIQQQQQKQQKQEEEEDETLEDPEFLESVLQDLPGVDSKSDEVQQALRKKKRRDGEGK